MDVAAAKPDQAKIVAIKEILYCIAHNESNKGLVQGAPELRISQLILSNDELFLIIALYVKHPTHRCLNFSIWGDNDIRMIGVGTG